MKKIVFLATMILSLSFVGTAYASGNPPERLSGSDRFEVAANIATKGWTDGADVVVLANYYAFADALSAAPIAYKNNAPILLTKSDQLTDTTKNEIKQLKPSKVIIVGGTGSVSQQVVKELNDIGISNIERISGKDRFEVSYNIAKQLPSTRAIVANGLIFPDAMSIGPYAAKNGIPILLSRDDRIPQVTTEALKGKTSTIVVGGIGSINQMVYNQLPTPKRIDGKDRYEVSANIIKSLNLTPEGAFIATGLTFADALTGSVLAAKEDAPLLLTRPDRLPDATMSIIRDKNIQDYVILGGAGSVNAATASEINDLLIPTTPVVYLVPHADDETLSFAADIKNQMELGRPVYLVLISTGDDSGARQILNGAWDDGEKVFCPIHKVYHDPVEEGYKDGYLTVDEFGQARISEFYRAGAALGVSQDHLFTDIVPESDFSQENIQQVIEKYLNMFPDADFRSMSWYDGHPPHAQIGATLKNMEDSGEISPFKTLYFVSIYTDRFLKKPIPLQKYTETLRNTDDSFYISSAINEYSRWDPTNGIYAIGMHSVPSQFTALKSNMNDKYHY